MWKDTEFNLWRIWSTFMVNKIGLRMEPSSTPHNVSNIGDVSSTVIIRSDLPRIYQSELNLMFEKRIWFQCFFMADRIKLKSNNTRMDMSFRSIFRQIASTIFSNADDIQCEGLEPDWNWPMRFGLPVLLGLSAFSIFHHKIRRRKTFPRFRPNPNIVIGTKCILMHHIFIVYIHTICT